MFQNRAVNPLQILFFFVFRKNVTVQYWTDSLVSADVDMQKCGRKRTYFCMEKKKRIKADEKRIPS